MATPQEIITRVQRIVRDPSYGLPDYLDYMNQGIRLIAGGITVSEAGQPDRISSPLPALMQTANVTTDPACQNPFIPLPNDYGRNLFWCSDGGIMIEGGVRIRVYETFGEFQYYYPNLTMQMGAPVIGVAVQGEQNLYYQGIPNPAQALIIRYYRLPNPVVDPATDPIDGLPVHLQEKLLESFMSWQLYQLIEDAAEGKGAMPNSDKWEGRFMKAMIELDNWIPTQHESMLITLDEDPWRY